MSSVVRHVVDSISPASAVYTDAARRSVAAAGAPLLEALAGRLGGAQHTAKPATERRTIAVIAGDHGAGDPGLSLGASHPTVIAASAIADGAAALVDVARAGRARILLIDAGAAEGAAFPPSVVRLGRGPSKHLLHEPAMTIVDATLGLEAGIALAMSLAEAGLDVLAVGALGIGSELAAAALLGAAIGAEGGATVDERSRSQGAPSDPVGATVDERSRSHAAPIVRASAFARVSAALEAGDRDPDLLAALHAGGEVANRGPLEQLAALGGPDTAVLAGLMLGAASIHIPTILDGHATGAAALAAAAFAPQITGYLIAAHGGGPIHAQILARLHLEPVFAVGLGHGEGMGAAMVLSLIDQVGALVR